MQQAPAWGARPGRFSSTDAGVPRRGGRCSCHRSRGRGSGDGGQSSRRSPPRSAAAAAAPRFQEAAPGPESSGGAARPAWARGRRNRSPGIAPSRPASSDPSAPSSLVFSVCQISHCLPLLRKRVMAFWAHQVLKHGRIS
uniref:Uncharacterized protein n=1 Tax=Molossus molossus TaxID=27622 RepID=A0A7J8FS29_MOLMO|nr:hypothetical protein HJG59_008421 [Molossus molossus]